MKKRWILLFSTLFFFFLLSGFRNSTPILAETASGSAVNIQAKAAVLMEGGTGKILYEKNKDTELVPASITKIMTLTLIFEALDSGKLSLDDTVTVSEYAAKMGGSQVYLEPNETQSVRDMIKCISIASANDAAVAMAEKTAGSEEAFVELMNRKAASLGMKHTHFKNCTGLDDSIESGHYSSAYDVALMSRELITGHPEISDYSTVWMDSITHKTKKGEKEFGLTNTNKLVRFYDGITGLKTGSTSKAKYCLSATAHRNGIDLIAVVMAAPDHKLRFSEAQALLDYGFANCSLYEDHFEDITFPPATVKGGIAENVAVYPNNRFSHTFTSEYDAAKIEKQIIYKDIHAPIKKGDCAGTLVYRYEGEEIGRVPLWAGENVGKAGYWDYLIRCLSRLFMVS